MIDNASGTLTAILAQTSGLAALISGVFLWRASSLSAYARFAGRLIGNLTAREPHIGTSRRVALGLYATANYVFLIISIAAVTIFSVLTLELCVSGLFGPQLDSGACAQLAASSAAYYERLSQNAAVVIVCGIIDWCVIAWLGEDSDFIAIAEYRPGHIFSMSFRGSVEADRGLLWALRLKHLAEGKGTARSDALRLAADRQWYKKWDSFCEAVYLYREDVLDTIQPPAP